MGFKSSSQLQTQSQLYRSNFIDKHGVTFLIRINTIIWKLIDCRLDDINNSFYYYLFGKEKDIKRERDKEENDRERERYFERAREKMKEI